MQIHWYDWITPTGSISTLFMAICVWFVVAMIVWAEDRQNAKLPTIIFSVGFVCIVAVIGGFFLAEFQSV
ncbi:hypothetical protein [Lentibacillus saliphilus]|uniref:hypothetical protein n=1 Tax=Lentibacillus saliphilus TaxID=2737028 RepID=UPI001C30D049|nr:hypothetical protein [Lentibacillus saliphilus]